MSNQLHLILSGKSGVGKTLFATQLVQYLKSRHRPHIAFDSSPDNPILRRCHHDTRLLDPNGTYVLECVGVLGYKTDLSIVDCSPAMTDEMIRYLKRKVITEHIQQGDHEVTPFIPITHDPESVAQARLISTNLKGLCRYVIVRNEVHGDDFRSYDKGSTRLRIIGDLGGRELTMKRMPPNVLTALLRHDPASAPTHQGLAPANPQKLEDWRREFDDELTKVADLLLPPFHTVHTIAEPPSWTGHLHGKN